MNEYESCMDAIYNVSTNCTLEKDWTKLDNISFELETTKLGF
jgi:hypothetical protein